MEEDHLHQINTKEHNMWTQQQLQEVSNQPINQTAQHKMKMARSNSPLMKMSTNKTSNKWCNYNRTTDNRWSNSNFIKILPEWNLLIKIREAIKGTCKYLNNHLLEVIKLQNMVEMLVTWSLLQWRREQLCKLFHLRKNIREDWLRKFKSWPRWVHQKIKVQSWRINIRLRTCLVSIKMGLLEIKAWTSWKPSQIILWRWRINPYMKIANRWKGIRELWCRNWVSSRKKEGPSRRRVWNNCSKIHLAPVLSWRPMLVTDRLKLTRGWDHLNDMMSLLHQSGVEKEGSRPSQRQRRMTMSKFQSR